MKIIRNLKILSATSLLAWLTACGGGGGTSTSGSGSAGTQSTILQGPVMKGPISLADVKAYAVDSGGNVSSNALATGVSDASGNYSLNIGTYAGPVVLVATPSSQSKMKDEVSGSLVTIPQNFKLRAATIVSPSSTVRTATAQSQQLSITPFSDLAYEVASGLGAGKLAETNIRKAIDLSKEQFGFDPVSSIAIDSTALPPSDASTEARRYAIALAAVSQMAQTGQATITDPATLDCLTKAIDLGSRIACATSHVKGMLVATSSGVVTPSKSMGDFVASVKKVDSNPNVNKTGITVSDSPSIAKLTEIVSQLKAGQPVAFQLSGVVGETGIAAAKALIQNIRSNGDDIEVSVNSSGIAKSADNFGKSIRTAGIMTDDVSSLTSLVSDAVNLWIDHRNGRVASPLFNTLGTVTAYNSYLPQGSCSILENKLPVNLGDYKFGNGLKGVPYIVVANSLANLKSATLARQADQNFAISQNIVSTSPLKDSWIGCSSRSQILTSLVDSVVIPGTKELSNQTSYTRSIRLRVDATDSASRPTQLTYYGMTIKNYPQQYSATDTSTLGRSVNLLDTPVFGTMKLAWSGDTLSSLVIDGDFPPSVDDSYVFDPKGYVVRDVIQGARYSVKVDAALISNSATKRANLNNFQLGYIPIGQSSSTITVDLSPTGQASYIEVPAQSNSTCADLVKTAFNLGIKISSSDGSALGTLKANASCSAASQVADNGSFELKGQIQLKNDAGNLLDLANASVGVDVTNKIPTIRIAGLLSMPNRAPLELTVSVTQERIATPSVTGKTSARIGYKQGSYSMDFSGLREESLLGDLVRSNATMSGSGGISMDWVNGQRVISVKENGKEIGTLNTGSKKLVFNDGTFEYLK